MKTRVIYMGGHYEFNVALKGGEGEGDLARVVLAQIVAEQPKDWVGPYSCAGGMWIHSSCLVSTEKLIALAKRFEQLLCELAVVYAEYTVVSVKETLSYKH